MKTDTQLYYEPISILDLLQARSKVEMSPRQLAFLCGLIKEYKPQKIVEIGVAAGGTSSVILNCISLLGLETEMYSIDLSPYYYRDRSKKTGYLTDEYKELAQERGGMKTAHILYTGRYAVECLEEIGEGIDLLILDSSHFLPDEILDFLACYPFLKRGSIVALHDLVLDLQTAHSEYRATKVLFDAVTAAKILDFGDLNLGAFQITSNTITCLEDVFFSLVTNWGYKPENRMLELYKNFYRLHFSEKQLGLFDRAVQMNMDMFDKIIHEGEQARIRFLEKIRLDKNIRNKRIFIYGDGEGGRKIHSLLDEAGIDNKIYHIISDNQKRLDTADESVKYLSEIEFDTKRDIIFIGVNRKLWQEVCDELHKRGIVEYHFIDELIWRI